MDLMTVFIIIVVAILLLVGILWLLSVVLGSGKKVDDLEAEILGTTESVDIEPKRAAAKPEPVAPQVEKAPPPEPDDLKVIEGIGPKIEGLLHDSGIMTFAQLAATPLINLQVILMEADMRIADPSTWAEQAALAVEGHWDTLKKLQDELKGGRKTA